MKEAQEEMPLASISGISCLKRPYTSQHTVPANISEYMGSERSLVDLVLIVFIACGKNAVVVRKAASRPIASINFMVTG